MLSINSLILRNLASAGNGDVEAGVTLVGPVSIGEKTIIRANSYIVGPVKIGDGCEIGPSVCILPSTSIASNVVISPFSLIENSIIGAGVKIGPGSSLQNSIVAAGSTIKGHLVSHSGRAVVPVEEEYHQVEIGTMMGSCCEVGESTLLEPGVIIGNYTHIKGMKVVRGNLPDSSIVM
jgi:glucose-1-phosphate thymidylyltransferase